MICKHINEKSVVHNRSSKNIKIDAGSVIWLKTSARYVRIISLLTIRIAKTVTQTHLKDNRLNA